MKQPIHPYAVYYSKEAADLLGLDPVTIQRYIRAGKLKATQLGKVYRISGQALLDLMSLDSDSVRMSQDRIRQIENATHIKSKAFLLNHEKGEQFFRLIDKTNDLLIALLNPDFNDTTEDELTLKYIGSRLLASGITSFHNGLNGYYQISFSIQRDLLETNFLLDLFRSFPERIEEWRKADDKELKEKFNPLAVRIILDERDGFKEKKRAERYQQYCKYASHMTYSGFTLLTNDLNQVEIGPFYNERKLLNCIHDVALNYSFAVMSLASLIKTNQLLAQKLAVEHMKMFHEIFKEKLPLPSETIEKIDKIHKLISEVINQKER